MNEPIPFPASKSVPEAQSVSSVPQDPRLYTNTEVSEIIRIALANANLDRGDTVKHEDLLAIGREFGLTPADIEQAFQTITKNQAEAEYGHRAALSFKLHAMFFVIVMAGLFLINLVADPTFWWFLYPLIAWGTALVAHGMAARYVPALPSYFIEKAWKETRGDTLAHDNPPRASFTIDELHAGFAQAKGIVLLEEHNLRFEFQISDTLFGGIKSRIKDIAVPLTEIAGVRVERRLWTTRLILQAHRLRTFQDLPENNGGEVKLSFQGAARAAAENLAHRLAKASGVKLVYG